MEWVQSGKPEDLFTYLYCRFLHLHTHLLYQQMVTVLDQRIDVPKTVLVVSTHFGLAHQLTAIKNKIAKEKKIKIILVVVVTDDSPQHIWYIPGADIIFVPSAKTKAELVAYGKEKGLPEVSFEVIPYPITPMFGERLSEHEFKEKIRQLDITGKSFIHISIPISGAAVGTDFLTGLIDCLSQKSERFIFHIVSKLTPFTQPFLNKMLERPFVRLYVFPHDREVVNKYEQIYRNNTISLEVTKPSEQAFKALINPRERGGSILLFSKPIGRQEYDNLDFLRRHNLLPNGGEQKYLQELFKYNLTIEKIEYKKGLNKVNKWRGVILPDNPERAAKFIWWCLKEKLFEKMGTGDRNLLPKEENLNELSSDGVKQFWERVTLYILAERLLV